MEDYKQVRDSLITMLEELDYRLGSIHEKAERRESGAEQKSMAVNTNVEQQTEEGLSRIEMEKIQQAIKRIDNQTYGICLRCGQPIKKAYLKSAPASGYCHHCDDDQHSSI